VGYGQVAQLHTRILADEGIGDDWVIGRLPVPGTAFARECGFNRHSRDPIVTPVPP
jgi:hypothetical protein